MKVKPALVYLAMLVFAFTGGCGVGSTESKRHGEPPFFVPPDVQPVDDDAQDVTPKGDEPGSKLQTFQIAVTNARTSPNWGPVLKDIVNHEAPGDSNPYEDLITLGHETSHGIHAFIRNTRNNTGRKANGFYLLNGKAVLVPEPRMRKSDVAPYIPASLRTSRYELYIAGQTAWDDRPLYIADEWNAYINGSAAGVDLAERGLWRAGWRDGVTGTLEFSAYAVALAMAAERLDPQLFSVEEQMREFIAYNLKRAMKLFFAGRKFRDFASADQDRFYLNFRDGSETAEMRAFLNRVYGERWVEAHVFTE